MTRSELEQKLETLQQGLDELRRLVLRQEGAILLAQELIRQETAKEEQGQPPPDTSPDGDEG